MLRSVVTPANRFMPVVYGTMTTSSWSEPNIEAPLTFSTPNTRTGTLLIRMIFPTGSSFGKSLSAVVLPRMQTLAAERTSASVNMTPSARSHWRMAR